MTGANTHPGTHREQRESVTLSKFEENQLHGLSKGEVAFGQNSQPPL